MRDTIWRDPWKICKDHSAIQDCAMFRSAQVRSNQSWSIPLKSISNFKPTQLNSNQTKSIQVYPIQLNPTHLKLKPILLNAVQVKSSQLNLSRSNTTQVSSSQFKPSRMRAHCLSRPDIITDRRSVYPGIRAG